MKVYVHGNCQATIIRNLINEVFPDWEVLSYEVFSNAIIDEINKYRDIVRTFDIIITQNIWHGYRGVEELCTHWIAHNKSESARLLTFPSLFFRGMHPAIYYLRNEGQDIENLGMPYHDLTLLYLMTRGARLVDLVSIMCAPDLYSQSFVKNEFKVSLDELRRREDDEGLTVKLSPWLINNGARRQFFHTINHPSREVMVFITNALLASLNINKIISIEGHDYLAYPHIAASPSVLRHLSATSNDESNRLFVNGMAINLSRRDFYSKSINYILDLNIASISDLLFSHPETASFVARLQADGIDRFLR